jgi:hypothetical protein
VEQFTIQVADQETFLAALSISLLALLCKVMSATSVADVII